MNLFCRKLWLSFALFVPVLIVPVTGAGEVLDWENLRKQAPAELLEVAETKRAALFYTARMEENGKMGKGMPFLGFFISGDGLGLCPLEPLCWEKAPTFRMTGGVTLKTPTVLAFFEEEGLALVKFAHKPEVSLTLSKELAPLGNWVAFLAPSFVPRIHAGPIIAHRRTSFRSNLRVQRKPIRNFSIAVPRVYSEGSDIVRGAPIVDAKGEVVAVFSFILRIPDQTVVIACPAEGLSTRIDQAVKEGKPLNVPIPMADQPFDPVVYSKEYLDACVAEGKRDYVEARKCTKAAVAKFPDSHFAKLWEYMMVASWSLEPEVQAELVKGLKVPEDAPAWERGRYFFSLGDTALRARGNHGEAIRNLLKSDELYPDGMACATLSWLYQVKGELKEAERYARRATVFEPDRIGYWVDLGKILDAQGKYEEADKLQDRVYILESLY